MTAPVKSEKPLRLVVVALISIIAVTVSYLLVHLILQGSYKQEFHSLIEDTRSLVKNKTVLDEDDPMWGIYGYKRMELSDDVRVTCRIDYIEGYIWDDSGKVYTSDSIECYNHDGDIEYSSSDHLVEWTVARDAQGKWRIADVYHVDMGEGRLLFGIPCIWG